MYRCFGSNDCDEYRRREVRLLKTKIELTKKQKLLIAAGIGMLILVILWPVSENSGSGEATPEGGIKGTGAQNTADETESLDAYVKRQEIRLGNVLSEIEGAGKVTVMITARASRELIVEKDVTQDSAVSEEEDSSGGRRVTKNSTHSESAVTDDSSGTASPYVIKSLEPEIEGIAVAAQGAGTAEIETEIINTVRALFDVPVHKISVVKMK